MRARSFIGSLLLTLVTEIAPAQSTPAPAPKTSVITPTRTAVLFGGLERDVAAAVKSGDAAALDRLLLDDFELIAADHPGQPVPRDEWQDAVLAARPQHFRIDSVSVREVGEDAALVTFAYEQQAKGKGVSGRFTFVDLWLRQGDFWRLQSRNAAPGLTSRVPGWAPPPAPIEKKY